LKTAPTGSAVKKADYQQMQPRFLELLCLPGLKASVICAITLNTNTNLWQWSSLCHVDRRPLHETGWCWDVSVVSGSPPEV